MHREIHIIAFGNAISESESQRPHKKKLKGEGGRGGAAPRFKTGSINPANDPVMEISSYRRIDIPMITEESFLLGECARESCVDHTYSLLHWLP